MALFWGLQNPTVNRYHPSYRTLWQAYSWEWDTRFGWFGLDDWRLERVNTATELDVGKFHFYDIPLSAPAVAAIGFASIGTAGFLCGAGLCFLLQHRRHPPDPELSPMSTTP